MMIHPKVFESQRPCMVLRHARGSIMLMALALLSLLALAVGAATPLLGDQLRRDNEELARAEIIELRRGIEAYFEDNEFFPPSLSHLAEPFPTTLNWLGPYAKEGFLDQANTDDDVLHDPWLSPYIYYWPGPYTALIRSRGANGIDEGGDGDDIELRFSVDYILWKITMRELRILRPLITAYNASVAPPVLPPPWVACVNRLQEAGLLPRGPATKFRFRYDGWRNLYVPTGDPCDGVDSLGPQ